jgi:hypothetical protein
MSNGSTNLHVASGLQTSGVWQYTTDDNLALYAYRFDGPNQDHKGNGHFKSVIPKPGNPQPKQYDIKLASPQFEIVHIEVHYGGTQFHGMVKNHSHAVIDNANNQCRQSVYCVFVRDKSNGAVIYCDPMITNDPH